MQRCVDCNKEIPPGGGFYHTSQVARIGNNYETVRAVRCVTCHRKNIAGVMARKMLEGCQTATL